MRSIIQLAGRILRHRDKTPDYPNLLLLQKNYKALKNMQVCFNRPGFESKKLPLESHNLLENLDEEQYKQITAIQRIQLPCGFRKKGEKYVNLIELEHKALASQLFSGDQPANIWWKNQPHWSGEVQRQQRFRDSKKDEAYYLWLDNINDRTRWKWKNEAVSPPEFGEQWIINQVEEITLGSGNNFLFDLRALTIYLSLAEDMGISLSEVSRKFGEVRITSYKENDEEYYYHPQLGVYQDI